MKVWKPWHHSATVAPIVWRYSNISEVVIRAPSRFVLGSAPIVASLIPRVNPTHSSLSRTTKMPRKPAIIIPLYNYPLTPLTWEPLYKAIASSPDLEFVVVVNPDSGPGRPGHPSPDANYAREVPKLNALVNVTTVGYVRTDYCRRSLPAVCQDVAKYAGWSTQQSGSGLFVQGIFLDETPNEHDMAKASYLTKLSAHIKQMDGIEGQRLVIANPGTPPHEALLGPDTDVAILFEQTYERYEACTVHEQRVLQDFEPSRAGYILHSVPVDKVARLARELRGRAGYLFVTSLRHRFYESFGPCFDAFVEAVRAD